MGGVGPLGGVDPRCRHFSAKMYAKTKELGPVGGGGHAPGTPPRSANAYELKYKINEVQE